MYILCIGNTFFPFYEWMHTLSDHEQAPTNNCPLYNLNDAIIKKINTSQKLSKPQPRLDVGAPYSVKGCAQTQNIYYIYI